MKQVICKDTGETFTDYREYLYSNHWGKKKIEFYSSPRFLGGCCVCNSKVNLNVHHITYANIGDEPLEDLTCLCDTCHEKFHNIKPSQPKVKQEKKAKEPKVHTTKATRVKLKAYKVKEQSFCVCCRRTQKDVTAYPIRENKHYHPNQQDNPNQFLKLCDKCYYELKLFRKPGKKTMNLNLKDLLADYLNRYKGSVLYK